MAGKERLVGSLPWLTREQKDGWLVSSPLSLPIFSRWWGSRGSLGFNEPQLSSNRVQAHSRPSPYLHFSISNQSEQVHVSIWLGTWFSVITPYSEDRGKPETFYSAQDTIHDGVFVPLAYQLFWLYLTPLSVSPISKYLLCLAWPYCNSSPSGTYKVQCGGMNWWWKVTSIMMYLPYSPRIGSITNTWDSTLDWRLQWLLR